MRNDRRRFTMRASLVGACALGISVQGAVVSAAPTPGAISVLASISTSGQAGNLDSGFRHAVDMTPDGRYVVFDSDASNLVEDASGDHNGDACAATRTRPAQYCGTDVFVRDAETATTTRVSVASDGTEANGLSSNPGISQNGRHVVFESTAANLVAGDTNGFKDIFARDLVTGATTRISLSDTGGEADGDSFFNNMSGAVSGDGRYVAFVSRAGNLVPGDTNAVSDIFVRDTAAGTTKRVSVASDGTQADNVNPNVSITPDGRYVAFTSDASNLAGPGGDTNGGCDVYVHDMLTGQTTRESVSSLGVEAQLFSFAPRMSDDGRYVAFFSFSPNLTVDPPDTNGGADVFVRDRVARTTEMVSVSSLGTQGHGLEGSLFPDISPDGALVTFASDAVDLVVGSGNVPGVQGFGFYAHNRTTGQTMRIDRAPDGTAGTPGPTPTSCPFPCYPVGNAVSELNKSGQYTAAYVSNAPNIVDNDNDAAFDIFRVKVRP